MKRKKEGLEDWPTFDAPLIQDVVAAFLRRRKAIAYQVRACATSLSCSREFSESPMSATERLNLDAGPLRLSVWADGAAWVSVCVRGAGHNAGWKFKDSFHGSTLDVSAEAVVGMAEATLSLRFGTEAHLNREHLRTVWARMCPFEG
jgi:hypothetical protein